MTDTTISVSKEFREELAEAKRDGESYESFLRRRLNSDGSDGSDEPDTSDGSQGSDGPDISDVMARLDDLEVSIPSKTAEELSRKFR